MTHDPKYDRGASSSFAPQDRCEDEERIRLTAEVHLHVHPHSDENKTSKAELTKLVSLLKRLWEYALRKLTEEGIPMTPAMQTLTDAVATNKAALASGITFIQGIKAALDAAIAAAGNIEDPQALNALSTELGEEDAAFAKAILDNTPGPKPPTLGETTIVLTSTESSTSTSAPVSLSATVTPKTPAGTPPSGSVAFLDGTISLGIAVMNGGVATLDTSFADASTHSLTAEYSGDATNAASISDPVEVVVN